MILNKYSLKRETYLLSRRSNEPFRRLYGLFDAKSLSMLLLNRRSTIAALCKRDFITSLYYTARSFRRLFSLLLSLSLSLAHLSRDAHRNDFVG